MKAISRLGLLLLLQLAHPVFAGTTQQTRTYIGRYSTSFPGPQACKDPQTGTTLYVESDGKHVAAISSAGKVLWIHVPHDDAHVEQYRTPNPQIVFIGGLSPSAKVRQGKPSDFVAIRYSNSQFGLLNISTGRFDYEGQD